MPTKEEKQEFGRQIIVERALSAMNESGQQLAAVRDGSGLEEVLGSGTYNSDDEYIRYEVSGDICGIYPVGP